MLHRTLQQMPSSKGAYDSCKISSFRRTIQNWVDASYYRLCDRTTYRPPGFSMSKDSFVLVEEAFHLHAATLESAYDQGGVCSDHLTYRSHMNDEDRLGSFPRFYNVGISTY